MTTTLEKLLFCLADAPIHDAHAVLLQLFQAYDIDYIQDEQLHRLCDWLNAPYYADDIPLTRAMLKGKIASYNSEGTAQDVQAAWRAIAGDDAYTKEIFPAEIELITSTPFTSAQATLIKEVMQKTVPAGVKISAIIYSPDAAMYDADKYDTVTHTAGMKTYAKILA